VDLQLARVKTSPAAAMTRAKRERVTMDFMDAEVGWVEVDDFDTMNKRWPDHDGECEPFASAGA